MAAYARRQYAGGALTTTVPLSVGSGDGSFTLATGGSTNWPDGSTGNFTVVIDAATPEKILCSARSGLVVTVASGGRGYDGTSATSHPAGSAIQCVHIAQDDDEANQVVSAVLGQSGAAKGDILTMLSAAGPNTLTRVALGTTGQVLTAGGSGLPVWSTVTAGTGNGAAIATSETTTSTSYTDLATVGPVVAITTGTKVMVTVTALLSNSATGGLVFMGFAISGATTTPASTAGALVVQTVSGGQGQFLTASFFVNVTAGANTFTAKYQVNGGTGTFATRHVIVQCLN